MTCATTPYGCSLDEAMDPREVGGKAATLGRMRRRGLPVPPGFVLGRSSFEAWLNGHAVRGAITALTDGLDPAAPDRVRTAVRQIRALALAAPVPPAVREALHALRAAIVPRARLIVRSSAIGEDSARASFAGQLDSLPGVDTAEALEGALVACWASYWSERALAYQLARGVRLAGMGVVVQELVPSRVSGVLFTVPPIVSGAPPRDPPDLLVEYCPGPGDAIVSGRVDPGRLTLSRDGRSWTIH